MEKGRETTDRPAETLPLVLDCGACGGLMHRDAASWTRAGPNCPLCEAPLGSRRGSGEADVA